MTPEQKRVYIDILIGEIGKIITETMQEHMPNSAYLLMIGDLKDDLGVSYFTNLPTGNAILALRWMADQIEKGKDERTVR